MVTMCYIHPYGIFLIHVDRLIYVLVHNINIWCPTVKLILL